MAEQLAHQLQLKQHLGVVAQPPLIKTITAEPLEHQPLQRILGAIQLPLTKMSMVELLGQPRLGVGS